jgi:ribosome modulation factor
MPPLIAKGWRESADKTPQHKYDIAITDYYIPLISEALLAYLDSLPIEDSIAHAKTTTLTKAEDDSESDSEDKMPPAPYGETAAESKAWKAKFISSVIAYLAVKGDSSQLNDTLQAATTDGYLAGLWGASQQLGATSFPDTQVGKYAETLDWANGWRAGNIDAALKVADGGLAALLDNVGVTIKDPATGLGIENSVLNSIGNKLATGLTQGLPPAAIARTIETDIGSTWRAEVIAQTEVSRAINSASVDTYSYNGVTEYSIVLSDDACDDCQGVADSAPYDVDTAEGLVPVHPNCRCSVEPLVSGASDNVDYSTNNALSDGEQ